MSEQEKKPTVTPAKPVVPAKPSVESLKVHLVEQEKIAMKHVGKVGHNPFLWIREVVRPLDVELHANPSDALFEKIKSTVYPIDGSVSEQKEIV